jgi:ribosomal protein S18 acetylase RimI-like enzyme
MPLPATRIPTTSDVERIKQIAVDANMFSVEEVGFFDELLSGYLDGSLVDHFWLVVDDPQGQVAAAAYYAPEPFADRMWNLYFIAAAPESQGQGFGGLLIEEVERDLQNRGDDVARVLIVETSSTDQYARTRTFYRNRGYGEEARIRQFYGPADDKVVFWKSLSSHE